MLFFLGAHLLDADGESGPGPYSPGPWWFKFSQFSGDFDPMGSQSVNNHQTNKVPEKEESQKKSLVVAGGTRVHAEMSTFKFGIVWTHLSPQLKKKHNLTNWQKATLGKLTYVPHTWPLKTLQSFEQFSWILVTLNSHSNSTKNDESNIDFRGRFAGYTGGATGTKQTKLSKWELHS